jgi:hypothetical protein
MTCWATLIFMKCSSDTNPAFAWSVAKFEPSTPLDPSGESISFTMENFFGAQMKSSHHNWLYDCILDVYLLQPDLKFHLGCLLQFQAIWSWPIGTYSTCIQKSTCDSAM